MVMNSIEMGNGKIIQMIANSPVDKEWTYRIPASLAKDVKFNRKLTSSNNRAEKYAVIKCKLAKGDNILTE